MAKFTPSPPFCHLGVEDGWFHDGAVEGSTVLTAPAEKVTDQDLSQFARMLAERLDRIAERRAAAEPSRACPICGSRRPGT